MNTHSKGSEKKTSTPKSQPQNTGLSNPFVQDSHPESLIQRAQLSPGMLSPDDVLQLQRTLGNKRTQRLLLGKSKRPSYTSHTSNQTVQRQLPPKTQNQPTFANSILHSINAPDKQSGAPERIQRDLAISPPHPDKSATDLLNSSQVSAALHYNLDRFANAKELQVMRDVLGLKPDVKQLIDEQFVQTIAGWQASHGLDVDGKIGVKTVRKLVAEYRAEAKHDPNMNAHADRLNIRTRPNEDESNITVNGHANLFDAILSHRDAQLTLVMRLDFKFHAGSVGTVNTAAEQAAFVRRFISDVRRTWAEQYALVPAGSSLYNNYLDTYFADIKIENTDVSPHYVVHVGNANSAYDNTDPPGPVTSGGPSVNHGHQQLRIGDEDTGIFGGFSRAYPDGTQYPMPQRTSAHEFGHMLGLPHINCDRNSMTCYGTTRLQRANIMGLGNQVTRANYKPFQVALKKISKHNWKVK